MPSPNEKSHPTPRPNSLRTAPASWRDQAVIDFLDAHGLAEGKMSDAHFYAEHFARKASELFFTLGSDPGAVRDLAELSPCRLLEVGCGAGGVIGHFSHELERNGIKVQACGVDSRRHAIEIARINWPQLEFRCEDFREKGRTADLLLMIDFLDQLTDPAALLESVRHHSRFFLFRIPLDRSVYNVLTGKLAKIREEAGHYHYYTRRSAISLLADTGYRVRAMDFTDNFRDPTNLRSVGAKINFLPRAALSAVSRSVSARIMGGHSLVVLAEASLDH